MSKIISIYSFDGQIKHHFSLEEANSYFKSQMVGYYNSEKIVKTKKKKKKTKSDKFKELIGD